MPGSNDFLSFAGGGGANVVTQAQYAALTTLLANGFTTGTAESNQLNKVWRQSSIMASVLGTLIADVTGQNVVDDGTTATIASNLMATLMKAGYVDDTGAVNAYVLTYAPAPLAYYDGMKVRFSTINANTTTNPTVNVNGLGAVTITGPSGVALVAGEIAANTPLDYVYNSTGPRFELQSGLGITQVAADARYAALAGLSTQVFSAAFGSTTNQVVALGQFLKPMVASSGIIGTSNVTATTGTFTAPCKGTLLAIAVGSSNGASGSGVNISASIGALTTNFNAMVVNSFGAAVATLDMTAGQSTTVSGNYTSTDAGGKFVEVHVCFIPTT